jgi:hypothetical protein
MAVAQALQAVPRMAIRDFPAGYNHHATWRI